MIRFRLYSYANYPARQALWHAIGSRTMRSHEIAKAIGVDIELPQELVEDVWDIVEPNAESWRQMGVFAPGQLAEGAPLQDRLLALTGRRPSPRSTTPTAD